jgi:hypothetical protein
MRTSPAPRRSGIPVAPSSVLPWSGCEGNYCVYGAHKLWRTARRAGHPTSAVARSVGWCRAVGVEGFRRAKRVRTTKADPGAGAIEIWSIEVHRDRANLLWFTDLTFVLTGHHHDARRDRNGPLVTRNQLPGLTCHSRCVAPAHHPHHCRSWRDAAPGSY